MRSISKILGLGSKDNTRRMLVVTAKGDHLPRFFTRQWQDRSKYLPSMPRVKGKQ